MAWLNLGILAHVDAGKTSLTERLLYAAGVIDTIGRVDDGSTQTDTLALERTRGITIKAAVVSFDIDGATVNLIDTPGHPDFIAEVERVLTVLDGAVLVVSAVEGVQPQTRVLMRTLRRLRIPTLLFVNKIDRRGARPAEVLEELRGKLARTGRPRWGPYATPAARTPSSCRSPTPTPTALAAMAEVLADVDEEFLATYLGDGPALTPRRVRGRAGRPGPLRVVPARSCSAQPSPAPGCPNSSRRLPRLLPASDRRPERATGRHGVQDRSRSGRGEDRVRAALLRHGPDPGPDPHRPRTAEPGHRSSGYSCTAATSRERSLSPARSPSSPAW